MTLLAVILLLTACDDGTRNGSQPGSPATLVPPPTSTPAPAGTAGVPRTEAPPPTSTPGPAGTAGVPRTEAPPTAVPTPRIPESSSSDSTSESPATPEIREQPSESGETGPPEPPLAVRPAMEIETDVLGYWSDQTASIEVTATVTNWDELGLEGSLLAAVGCIQDGRPVGYCGETVSFSPPTNGGLVEGSITLRVPTGSLALEFHYGGDAQLAFEVDVPRRIVGVDRDVWECFSDMSTAGTVFEELRGVGCAAWETGTVQKYGQSFPVTVFIDGPEGFTHEFKEVLAYLSPVMNLRFHEVPAAHDAGVVAYIGTKFSDSRSNGAICFDDEDYGCAEGVWLYDEPRERIVVFNHWPEQGDDLGDFGEPHRTRFRSSMIYAVVHSLSGMGRRADEFSLMNETVDHRAELNPMDEALLRLHGHELVEPEMSFDDIRQLIVFNDEMLGPQVTDPGLQAWLLLRGALERLRDETTIRYQVRAHSPDCPGQYGWGEYTAGNLTGRHPFMGWVRLDDGTDQVYTLWPDIGVQQFWRRSASGWDEISYEEFSETVSAWEGHLSDPHFLLSAVLHNADRIWIPISVNYKGQITVKVRLDSVVAPFLVENGRMSATFLVDPNAQSVIEYIAAWDLDERSCDIYLIEAKDGELGVDFVFPDEIRRYSRYLDPCEAMSLGTLSGYKRIGGVWARECGPGTEGDGYGREFRFSLDDWNFVRLDLLSHDDIRLDLYRMSGSEREAVAPEAAGHPVGGYGQEQEDARLRWAHLPLGAGDYVLEAVSLNRASLGEFTLTLSAQPTPPPPYRFRDITTGGPATCGILLDGTLICWGANPWWDPWRDQGWLPPEGRFQSISSGGQVCAVREEGSAECWGGSFPVSDPPLGRTFKEISAGWVHACALRSDGTPVCWGRDQGGKASPPAEERLSQVSAGTHHSCGVRPDGTAVCWGGGNKEPWEVQGGPFASISLGGSYYCALRLDGDVLCWGGDGLTICETLPGGWGSCSEGYVNDDVPQAPPENERFTSFSTGEPNCALRADGSPVCWSEYLTGPFPEPQDERFTTVSATRKYACGLRPDGTAVCWGSNRFGQASPPSGVSAEVRDYRTLPTGLVEISSGGLHSCALDSDGRAVCWGPNWWRNRFTGEYVSIASGGSHACALRADGTVECRGGDSGGQASPPDGTFTAISAGYLHTCGLRPDGTAECWGDNGNGRLIAPPGEVFQSISSGLAHNCGLRLDGTAACWGGNWDRADLAEAASPPGGEFTAIISGSWHSCGLRLSGEVECWGLDRKGQSSPPDGPFGSITSGAYHTCGLRSDGTAECWGAGSPFNTVDYNYGQGFPPEGGKFVSISSGDFHTCGIREDGSPVCWGRSDFGQITPLR